MQKPLELEVFFDYACPYCMRGHEYLTGLLSRYPRIGVVWRPCESHPRPERYGVHSDLCIRGMFYAAEHGAGLPAYHATVYRAIHADTKNAEDAGALADYVGGLLGANAFLAALRRGTHLQELKDANRYAYEQLGVWVVPAYRMGGKRLDVKKTSGSRGSNWRRFWAQRRHSQPAFPISFAPTSPPPNLSRKNPGSVFRMAVLSAVT